MRTLPAPFQNPSDDEIRALLERARTIAVVGLSPRPERASHAIAGFLVEKGYRVFGVRPGYDEILGCPCYAKLGDIPQEVDVVDVFRRPEFVPAHVEQAIAAGAGAVWLQLGVIHEEAALRAREQDLIVVMNRCILVEHERLLGG